MKWENINDINVKKKNLQIDIKNNEAFLTSAI